MTQWNQVVEILREAIFFYAQASNGNLAAGILAVTFLARLAVFPLTLRLARLAAAHRDRIRQIQPELDAARARFKHDPQRLAQETRHIFSREGIPMLPLAGVVSGLLQTPVWLALFSAVRQCAAVGGRFLWIADISKPDRVIAVGVTALTAASLALVPQSAGQNRMVLSILPALFTLLVLSKMAAGIGLYWAVSSAFGLAQTVVVTRHHSSTAI